jgi:hypothetical protein
MDGGGGGVGGSILLVGDISIGNAFQSFAAENASDNKKQYI